MLLRNIVLLEPIRAYIDALVHPSARSDVLAVSRHRAFIAIRLLVGLIVFATVPVHLAARGAPTLIEALVFAALLSPLLVVAYLSRTGNFERAHVLSAGVMTAIVSLVAAATGGIVSFVMPWLAVIPFEATLSTSRRVVLTTIGFAVSAALLLWGFGVAGLLPQPGYPIGSITHLAGVLSAALYAGAIAVGASALARGSERVKLITDSRYHLLAQNMTDVITRHSRNGAVTFVSPAAERLVGVPAAALMVHGLFERVHVADRPAFLTALTDAARGCAASVAYRLRRGPLAADGEAEAVPHFIWVETRCRMLDRGKGMDAGAGEVVAVTRDITRNKEDALELERAHAEAERANEAKSRFLATVSHELRTPLNAIIGFSEMLTNERAFDLDLARRQDYARVIRESGQHLLAVVNSILDVSRIEAGHFEIDPEPLAIGPLAESCYEMMLLRAEQTGVSLDLDIVPDLPEVVADKIAVRQVLINLISNAVKFTPSGGSVKISVRAAGPDLLLSVTDTGIGISEADLAQVGNPFFQAASAYDRPYEGTGLGLSVVKGLIDLHGGSFEIKSRIGEGTRVLVRLPREGATRRRERKPGVVERLPQRPAGEGEEEGVKVKRSA